MNGKEKCIALIFTLLAGTAFAGELSFQRAVQEMFEQNPGLAQSKIQSSVSLKQLDRTKAAYLPQLDFVQSGTYSNNPVYVFGSLLNQQRFTQADFALNSINHPDPLSDFSSRFQLGWVVFDFGKRESRIHTAESGYRISALQEDKTRLALLQELVRRYYAVSLARQRFTVASEALKSADARLQQARDRVSEGLVVQSDQLAAEVFRAQRLQEQIDAENQLKIAIAALYELLGVTNEDDALSTDDLKERQFSDLPLSYWQDEMKNNVPELKIVYEAGRAAHSRVGEQKAAFLPSIEAWSNYEWHGHSFDYTGNSWGMGFELKWNLFRGFSDQDQLSEAKLEEQSSRQKQRETENALQLRLKQAYYRFQSSEKKLAVSSAMVTDAAESKRIYSDRYSSEMVTIQDLLQAETAHNESRLAQTQTLYEYYVAYAELLGAAGKGNEIEQIEVQQ